MNTADKNDSKVGGVLVIEKDSCVFERESREWAKLHMEVVRVNAIHGAVERLLGKEPYTLITLNGDSVPDYASEFPLLREATGSMIIIRTNSYSHSKRLAALRAGADALEPFTGNSGCDVDIALSLLDARNRMVSRMTSPGDILKCGDILLSLSQKRVFIRGNELILTKTEFKILTCFIQNQSMVLTFKELFQKIWGYGPDVSAPDALWSSIKRLRSKMSAISPEYGNMIVNIHGYGYRMSTL